MGFYGNIKDIERNSSFVFDKIYANRKQMDENALTDDIYTGRYVLIEYDTDTSSLDYKKAFMNPVNKTIAGYNVLYLSDDYSEKTTILFDETNSSLDGDLLKGITPFTIVYINKDGKNQYYECIGYFTLTSTGECTVIDNATITSDTFSDTSLLDKYKADKKYALFNFIAENSALNSNNNYAINYNIDAAYAKEKGITMSGHGWDSTVWQKTIVGDTDKYVMVAELNTVIPTFGLSADAPTQTPLMPHFDAASTDVYYNLHWQPSWGLRTQLASAEHSDGQSITEPGTGKILSDDTTTWIRKVYDKETDRINTYYYTKAGSWKRISSLKDIGEDGYLPAAVYFNKDGFNSAVRYHSSLEDKVGIDMTGYSQTPDANGKWNNTQYNSHVAGRTESAVDTQEMSVILPAIGNAISEMWDLVYGSGDKKDDSVSARLTDISWRESPAAETENRLSLIKTEDGSAFNYTPADVETLAGAINSTHDLMGMIVQDVKEAPESLEDFANNKASNDYIYYFDNKFYRKTPLNTYTELTPNEYTFIEAPNELDELTYNNYTYYIKQGDEYVKSTGKYDPNETYYIRTVPDRMVQVELSTFQDIMGDKDYLYKNANGDYIYSNEYSADKQYYTIDAEKAKQVSLQSGYKPNQFYYKRNDDYYLDTNLTGPTDSIEYVLQSATPITARYVYLPGLYYTSSEVSRIADGITYTDTIYSINTASFKAGVKYYSFKQLQSEAEVNALKDSDIIAYKRKAKVQAKVSKGGEDRLVFYFIKNGEDTQIELWQENENTYHLISNDEVYNIFDSDGKINGKLRPNYRYVEDSIPQYVKYVGKRDDITYNEYGQPIFYTHNPYDAEYQSVNELYGLIERTGLLPALDQDEYYKIVDKNYIKVTSELEIPSYDSQDNTKWYKVNFKQYVSEDGNESAFYQSNTYYYQGTDGKSWYFDKNGIYNAERIYYLLPDEAITREIIDLKDMYLYEPGKYYYKKHNRLFVDTNASPTAGRVYYFGADEYYVYHDEKEILPLGMHWNTALPVPHSISLARKNDTTYTMSELVGFARKLNTIHGLILQINNFLEYGNETTRDPSTVQGVLNSLNDIISRFEILDWGEIVVTDGYGRMHTAPIVHDKWIKSYVDPDVAEPTVNIKHMFNPIDDTTSEINMNAEGVDSIALYEPLPDATGHIVNKNTRTITLPYGIKTINADSGLFVADNTQDSFNIKSADLWLSTTINGDTVSLAHENPQSISNTKGLLENASPNFGDSFVIPKVCVDSKGHVNTLEEFLITLPKPSLTPGTGNVVTNLELDPITGAFVETKESAGKLVLSVYDGPLTGEITNEDTIASAIGKNAQKIAILNSDENTVGSLAYEARLRSEADTTLSSTLNTKIDNNKTTIDASITALQTVLQSNIDAVSNRVLALENLGLSTEIANLKVADTGLGERIKVLEDLNIATKIKSVEDANAAQSSSISDLSNTITDLIARIEALENAQTTT